MKKNIIIIIITIMIFQLFLFSNFSSAQVNLDSTTKKDDDNLLVTLGLSNDEILKLDYRSEILANALRTQSITENELRTITKAFLTPIQKGLYVPNSGQPKGTPPSPKEPERIPMKVKFNGNLMDFEDEQLPIIKYGVTLIPLRVIFEKLGAKVEWNQDTYTVTATKENTTIVLSVGDSTAIIDGAVVKLEQPSEIVNDKTMIPLRFVSEALGAKVDWNPYARTVLIYNELILKTLAYVVPGSMEHNVVDALGSNYQKIISTQSQLPVWRYDDKATTNYSVPNTNEVNVDFQGLSNGSLRSQLFVYWKEGRTESYPLIDHFVLYHFDEIDQKIHELHIKRDVTIEEVILDL
ncbi:copper amine oxidase N-terminal domain-containing protein [Paenibacillus sp. LjRoot56]|uniref:copper amine oxidase N-terminal domain-containing protein n=1 Tax=Paenibacillus sp. LjRoot56 TaxID=3342333 RepID=UPI003ECC943E